MRFLLYLLASILFGIAISSAIVLAMYFGVITAMVGTILSFAVLAVELFAIYWFQDKLVLMLFGGEVEDKVKYQPELNKLEKMVAELAKIIHPMHTPKISIKCSDTESDNAAATGRIGKPTIIVTKGLMDDWQNGILTDDEIKGIIAHEMAHLTFHHATKSILLATLCAIAVGYLLMYIPFLLPTLPIYGVAGLIINEVAIPTFMGILPTFVLMTPFKNTFESNADIYGVKWSNTPLALASALNKLTMQSEDLSAGSIFRGEIFLGKVAHTFFSLLMPHPSTNDRIKQLEKIAAASQKNRVVGTSSYLSISKSLDKLDEKCASKLGHWATTDNSKIKNQYADIVTRTITQSTLPDRFKELLFFRASNSKTATAGSGFTITRTQVRLRNALVLA